MMKAFAYFVFSELDEVFHIYNSPFQDKTVKDTLVSFIANVSKEKITEIVSTAIGGEDIKKYLAECEKMIVANRSSAKNPEEETVGKYLLGVQIMFDDSEGGTIKNANQKIGREIEEFALEIYKNNMVNFVSSADRQG